MWIAPLLLQLLVAAPTAPAAMPAAGPLASQEPSARHPAPDLDGATLYEVNVRQFSPAGDLEGVRAQLPRLAALGVDVLWLMPIHPIGEERRKGTLGSYYSVADFTAVNPEFGTLDDLRRLVDEAHDLGLRVILDWVANHTAWDHPWTGAHPEWYTRGPDGGFVPPVEDWSDVIDLDYGQPGLRRAMTDALRFWVEEADVDGFRCDVAEMVPRDFWEAAIAELRGLKPLFLLAEGADPWLYEAGFDATYGWWVANTVVDLKAGRASAADLRRVLADDSALHAEHPGHFRIHFTSNHDWNSWHGIARERLGPAWETATVLSFTLPGMPLVYTGQEAGLDEQLEFFERDPVRWRRHPDVQLYRALAGLVEEEPALARDADLEFAPDGFFDERLLAFMRRAEGRSVSVVVNLSPQRVPLPDVESEGLLDLWGFPASASSELEPWGWRLFRQPLR